MTAEQIITPRIIVSFLATLMCVAFVFALMVNGVQDADTSHPYDNILNEMRKPQWRASTAIDVLSGEEAARSLGLDSAHHANVSRIVSKAQEGSAKLWREWRKENANAKPRPFAPPGLDDLLVDKHREVLSELTEEQKRRLDQLVWRQMGWHFVFEPHAAAEMGLTKEQQTQFKDLLVERTRINSDYARAWRDGDSNTKTAARSKFEREKTELSREFLAILSVPQRITRHRLLGPSMELDASE